LFVFVLLAGQPAAQLKEFVMKITPQLKQFLTGHGVAADATDEDIKAATTRLLVTNVLTAEKYAELSADPAAAEADELMGMLTKAVADGLRAGNQAPASEPARPQLPDIGKALAMGGSVAEVDGVPRVKRAHEQYAASRSELRYPASTNRGVKHPLAGQLVGEGEGVMKRVIEHPSRRDAAVSGAYIKWSLTGCRGIPAKLQMTDHDKDLIHYAMTEMEWGGESDRLGNNHEGIKARKLQPSEQKALIDDNTSGGLEAAPIVFDDMLITTPLLYGEFFPSVNVVPISRGRRIEGVSIGNVTLSSGGADNTNIPLFTTTAFIAAFDTNIYVCDGAIEIGLDFISDSPIDVVGEVQRQYGIRQLAWLDEQIAIGDGTTEPEGITVASGTTSVAGGSAAPTVGVYESFFFGVTKKYKQGYPSDRIMFGANETTYQRARAIAVGASDARRIFGMTHGDYMLMGHKYGISEAMANTQAFFANMARYRMYRRMGITIKATTEGQTLVRKNLLMISARGRWGGQLEDGGAAAYSSTMQA
jgi:HK97 family phage major capsid protein